MTGNIPSFVYDIIMEGGYMKKFLTILSLLSVMLTATSCMRGGNADKGDDGYIGNHDNETSITDTNRNDYPVTTDRNTTTTNNNDRRILDTYDEHEGRIKGLPSRIRRNIESGIDDVFPDHIENDMRRDIK